MSAEAKALSSELWESRAASALLTRAPPAPGRDLALMNSGWMMLGMPGDDADLSHRSTSRGEKGTKEPVAKVLECSRVPGHGSGTEASGAPLARAVGCHSWPPLLTAELQLSQCLTFSLYDQLF